MAHPSATSPPPRRRPGRPSATTTSTAKPTQPPSKKRKLTTPTPSTLNTPTPSSPAPPSEPKPNPKPVSLPSRIYDFRPLPTLSSPQALSPADRETEYQPLAASGVLAASLTRSRNTWINSGVLDRYWVKPKPTFPTTAAGKKQSAKGGGTSGVATGSVGSGDTKFHKTKGYCRLRVEPLVFEIEVFVDEGVNQPQNQKAKAGGGGKPFAHVQTFRPGLGQGQGQGYRQGVGGQQQMGFAGAQQHPQQGYWSGGRWMPYTPHHHQQQYQQQQPYLPAGHLPPAHPVANTLSPLNVPQNQNPTSLSRSSSPQIHQNPTTTNEVPANKPPPDPVITKLASLAAHDSRLKALMKEVATGKASPEQLREFQGHIDDLTKDIGGGGSAAAGAGAGNAGVGGGGEQGGIQYDTPQNGGGHQGWQSQQRGPYQPQPQQHFQQQQQPHVWTPPPPPASTAPATPSKPLPEPVILAFTTPGATEDRFLFPRHCILESLSPQHLLCSFLVTRKAPLAKATNPKKPKSGASEGTDTPSAPPKNPSSPTQTSTTEDAAAPSAGNSAPAPAPQIAKQATESPSEEVEEVYQPITLMLEVAYNREFILDSVRKWVLPASEVRAHMTATMLRCKRAEDVYLPFCLPVKGGRDWDGEEEILVPLSVAGEMGSREGTAEAGVGAGARKGVKRGPYKKKGVPAAVNGGDSAAQVAAQGAGQGAGQGTGAGANGEAKALDTTTQAAAGGVGVAKAQTKVVDAPGPAAVVGSDVAETEKDADVSAAASTAAVTGEKAETVKTEPLAAPAPAPAAPQEAEADGNGSGRPKRTTRKSVRISLG